MTRVMKCVLQCKIKIIYLRRKKKPFYVHNQDLLQQPKINKFMFGFKEAIRKGNRKPT